MTACIDASFFHGRREKTLPSPALGRERSNTSWCHPISAAVRPFLLLLRGACRGCFHPRSSAVLARPAAVRFQPAAHLSAGGVVRVTPADSTRLSLILCDYPPVVKALYAVKGLLLGFTMSRQSQIALIQTQHQHFRRGDIAGEGNVVLIGTGGKYRRFRLPYFRCWDR